MKLKQYGFDVFWLASGTEPRWVGFSGLLDWAMGHRWVPLAPLLASFWGPGAPWAWIWLTVANGTHSWAVGLLRGKSEKQKEPR